MLQQHKAALKSLLAKAIQYVLHMNEKVVDKESTEHKRPYFFCSIWILCKTKWHAVYQETIQNHFSFSYSSILVIMFGYSRANVVCLLRKVLSANKKPLNSLIRTLLFQWSSECTYTCWQLFLGKLAVNSTHRSGYGFSWDSSLVLMSSIPRLTIPVLHQLLWPIESLDRKCCPSWW